MPRKHEIKPRHTRATIADLSREAGIPTAHGQAFVDAIIASLLRGKEVRLQNLGNLVITESEARIVETPMINEGRPTKISARKTARFRRSPILRDRLNGIERNTA